MPDTSQEALKNPFNIAVPAPVNVMPTGSTATRDSGLSSMKEFLEVPDLTGAAGLAGKTALVGGQINL